MLEKNYFSLAFGRDVDGGCESDCVRVCEGHLREKSLDARPCKEGNQIHPEEE